MVGYTDLFKMTRAQMTPGTQPQRVKSNTIRKDPQPFPKTDRGGNKMASNTLQKLMSNVFVRNILVCKKGILLHKCQDYSPAFPPLGNDWGRPRSHAVH